MATASLVSINDVLAATDIVAEIFDDSNDTASVR